MAETGFWEKFFSGGKCWKYAGNRRFGRFSSDFFLMFLCFFHRKTLLITMPAIKHGSIVNKTDDFCCQNFLKITGTADFRRKNGISWISRAVLYICSWNLSWNTVAKWWCPKCDFSGQKCRKYAWKPVFGHFLKISSLVFSDFLHKDAY